MHPIDDDNEYNLLQMVNATIQSTPILPQLVTLTAQMDTQLNKNKNNGVNYNSTGGGNKVPFGRKFTAELMVHAISKGGVVGPRQNSTKIYQNSIKTSTIELSIFAIVKVKKMPDSVGRIVK